MQPPLHLATTVLFRCDAGAKHGLGHLSRCLTLAAALSKAGAKTRFALNAPAHIRSRVEVAGYPVRDAGSDVGSDEPSGWLDADLRLLVIDSKDATSEYVRGCRRGSAVACFDDETARDLPCDVLINNNIWSTDADYGNDPARKLLIGPSFNTVGPDYFRLADQPRNGLLITLGGEDPHNHTEWLVRNLASMIGVLPTHVCIGPAHPDPEAVVQGCEQHLPHATIHRSPTTLLAVAARCHLALSAGGTTCYELAAAGIAMAVVAVEKHQARLVSAMVKAGAALSLGGPGELNAGEAARAFASLSDSATAARLAEGGKRLFPKPGVEKILGALASAVSTRSLAA